MDNNDHGSSVDPADYDDIQIRIREDTSRDSAYTSCSLSNMSDLEDDAEIWLESPRQSMSSEQQSPVPSCAPLGGGNLPSKHDVGGQSVRGRTSGQETHTNYEEGASYQPQINQSVPDDRYDLKRDPSVSSLESSYYEPKQEIFDAVIICHPDDKDAVEDIRNKLNELKLYDGKRARVALEKDNIISAGKQETKYFEEWLEKAVIMFFYASRPFFSDEEYSFKEGVAIFDSFFNTCGKREYVIPIFLESKRRAKYVSPSMRSIKGIDIYDREWTEIAQNFKTLLNNARSKIPKKEDNLEKGLARMQLED